MKYLRNLLAALLMFALIPLAGNVASAQTLVYRNGRMVRVYRSTPRPTLQIQFGNSRFTRERAHQAYLARIAREREHQAYLGQLAAERSGDYRIMRIDHSREMRERSLERYHAELARER